MSTSEEATSEEVSDVEFSNARIVVGPIVGMTTCTTTRILLEADNGGPLCVHLTVSGTIAASTQVDMLKNRPCVFAFGDLQAGTSYEISVEGASNASAVTGRVKTLSNKPKNAKLGVVSCNDIDGNYCSVDESLLGPWKSLGERVQAGELDFVVHVGDQVYADPAFEAAMAMPIKTEKHKEAIRELYRGHYRSAWGHPDVARVLSSVPNAMIWDDHEIRNNWGANDTDSNPKTKQYKIALLGREVFWEYQRALRDDDLNLSADDPDLDVEGNTEHYIFELGDTGVVMVDQRSARSFAIAGTDTEKALLGDEQWEDLEESLESGLLSEKSTLAVVTTCPLAYLDKVAVDLAIKSGVEYLQEVKDQWVFDQYNQEQLKMLQLLDKWKSDVKGREVIVIGGDVHVGGMTDMEKDDQPMFRQIVASPIVGPTMAWFALAGNHYINRKFDIPNSKYSYHHRNFQSLCNYGVVTARYGAQATIDAEVIYQEKKGGWCNSCCPS